MVATPRDPQPRFLRRPQNRPALRRRNGLVVFAQLIMVASGLGFGGAAAYYGHDYILHNQTFRLRNLVLDGVPLELRDAVGARLGGAHGANLLLLDLEELQRQLESVPQVLNARIRRVLPDSLEVLVEPRPAWGVLHARDGSGRVARNGIVLGAVRPSDRALPALSVDDDLLGRIGGDGHLPPDVARTFGAAVQVVQWLQQGHGTTFGPIDVVRLEPGGVVLVARARQWEIAIGSGEDLDAKEQNLLALIRQEMPMGRRLIDLRYRDMVVVSDLDAAVAELGE